MVTSDLWKTMVVESAESALHFLSPRKVLAQDHAAIMEKLFRDGIVVVPGFYSREFALKIRDEIDRTLREHSGFVWKDDEDSDHRLFGADRVSPLLRSHLNHPVLDSLGTHYTGTPMAARMTVAAKMIYRPGNRGSGAGWHRDSPVTRQFKALLYLTDVTPQSGPFQYLVGSHRKRSVLRFISRGLQTYRQYRFTDQEIDAILRDSAVHLQEVTGSAGDIVLVDTKGIHRGAPILEGERYALTNYYWAKKMPTHMANSLIARPPLTT